MLTRLSHQTIIHLKRGAQKVQHHPILEDIYFGLELSLLHQRRDSPFLARIHDRIMQCLLQDLYRQMKSFGLFFIVFKKNVEHTELDMWHFAKGLNFCFFLIYCIDDWDIDQARIEDNDRLKFDSKAINGFETYLFFF